MKHFTVTEIDISKYKTISGPLEVVGGSRPRLTLIHKDTNQKFFFKTYTHNPREVWAECLASHVAELADIKAQSVTIKIAPDALVRAMRERYGDALPKDWKPVGTLARNIFPKNMISRDLEGSRGSRGQSSNRVGFCQRAGVRDLYPLAGHAGREGKPLAILIFDEARG